MRLIPALAMPALAGCLTWSMEAAPTPPWNPPTQECDSSYGYGAAAGAVAVGTGGALALLAARANPESGVAPSERAITIALVAPVVLIFAIDSLVAFGRAGACRTYKRIRQRDDARPAPEVTRGTAQLLDREGSAVVGQSVGSAANRASAAQ